ncbi:RecX family transcriptional regulator [Tsuneonella suprasediminis]|uniref:RecX family transcriptional regulator n=1 Tax=Tsuneonella suprasediminis TaxID=2306996 RepID=A0A419R1G1_9SPHN|nr:RecX family transcriptional regulator [Tsuneonella suprasediminis]
MVSNSPRSRRKPAPLDAQRLEEIALSYVARFSTSTGKLRDYLARKVRERGWDGAGEPNLNAIVERFADRGYVDDAAWAQSRRDGLLQRGYGPRRVAQDLDAAGISAELHAGLSPDEAGIRRAAIKLATRRRFGPWSRAAPDPAIREKQIAAIVRAGHRFDIARTVVEAHSVAAVEQWAAEADESEEDDFL